MRLGLISDVHGNRVALEAVVADGVQQGVDVWWVLGDLVAIGVEPIPTLELLADLPGVQFVRGEGGKLPPDGGDQKQSLKERALSDTGVQTMLDVFAAEIKDVEEM